MRKGFTLAELLGVIVVLAAVLLIIMPTIDKTIKQGQNGLYDKQINSIKLAMELWVADNVKLEDGEYIVLTLSQLKDAGLVEFDAKNPKTEELFPNDMLLTIRNNDGILEYEVSTKGDNVENYELLPRISINGNILTYVEVNSEYVDRGASVTDQSGNVISSYVAQTIEPELNVSMRGVYLEKYTTNYNGYSNTVYRTIIVRDTIGPEIIFSNNLELTYEEAKDYNFESDIIIKDNSGEKVELTVEDNIMDLPGRYTVKYIAVDTSGNETVKVRQVTIKE